MHTQRRASIHVRPPCPLTHCPWGLFAAARYYYSAKIAANSNTNAFLTAALYVPARFINLPVTIKCIFTSLKGRNKNALSVATRGATALISLLSHLNILLHCCTAALQEAGRGPGSNLSCLETSSKSLSLGRKNYKVNVHEKNKNLLESSGSSRAIFTPVCNLSHKPHLHPLFSTEKKEVSAVTCYCKHRQVSQSASPLHTLVYAFLARSANVFTVSPSSYTNDVVHEVHHLQRVKGKHATGCHVTCFSTTTAAVSTTSL